MKHKSFLGLILLGLVPLLTSCVDGDYYDLFEDDEELLLPRNKKGKDGQAYQIDDYLYTFLIKEGCENGWYFAECAACCYSNFTGADRFFSRIEVIRAQYGCINNETVGLYSYGVTEDAYGYKISPGALARALGWHLESVRDVADAMYNGTIDWSKLAIVLDDNSHVAAVTGHTTKTCSNGKVFYLTYKDQYSAEQHCSLGRKDDGGVLQDPCISQFITP